MCDLISRQLVIKTLCERRCGDKPKGCPAGFCTVSLEIDCIPSAEPEWNNHTVACLLAEMFGDDCACNFNGIDEWLPEKCEVIESCPNPVGVACWEQFLKHRAERKTNEQT